MLLPGVHSSGVSLRGRLAQNSRRALGRNTRHLTAINQPSRYIRKQMLQNANSTPDFAKVCQSLAVGRPVSQKPSTVQADQLAVVGFGDLYRYDSLARFAYMLEGLHPVFAGHVVSFCLGDICGDHPWARETRGQSSLRLMRSLGAQAGVIGNHELTLRTSELEGLLKSSAQFGAPWLGANLLRPGAVPVEGVRSQGVLRKMNGIQVGILGVVGDWRSEFNGGSAWVHTDAIESAKAQVRFLQASGAEMILALTHMSLDENRDLARKVPEVDLILAGHNHVPHYEVVDNTILLEPGQNLSHFAGVSVQLIGGQLYLTPQLLEIGDDVPRSENLVRVMKDIEADFVKRSSQRRSRTLIALEGPLDTRKVEARIQETSGGNLVADAFRDWAVNQLDRLNQKLTCPVSKDKVVALTNGGGIRKNELMGSQQITVGTVEEIITQDNTLCLIPVQGRFFKQILEAGVAGVSFDPGSKKRTPIDGRFLQVSGIQFDWDPSQPEGQRVSQIHINGQRIEVDQIYYIATNDFTAKGGNHMEVLVQAAQETASFSELPFTESHMSMKEALVGYLESLAKQGQRTYQAATPGQRIRII